MYRVAQMMPSSRKTQKEPMILFQSTGPENRTRRMADQVVKTR